MVKVGDRVRVIAEPPSDRSYGPAFVFEMDKFCGSVGNVRKIICKEEEGGFWFNINLDDGYYTWCEDFIIHMNQRSE